jgi:hypothetical protein
MRRCIVNVANGGWYPAGQERLLASLVDAGYAGDVLAWRGPGNDAYSSGRPDALDPTEHRGELMVAPVADLPGPPHGDAPYAFKYWALQEARKAGYDLAVWCDSSVRFIGPPDLLHGAALPTGFWAVEMVMCRVGGWCSDAALEGLGLSRAEANKTPMAAATCFSVDMRQPPARELLRKLRKAAKDGLFLGDWTNERGQVSSDPGVKGHRHDQSCLSVFARQLGLPLDKGAYLFGFENAWTRENSVAVAAGM